MRRKAFAFGCVVATSVVLGQLLEVASTSSSAAPQITLQLMAAKPSWTNSEYVGHAFMCMALPLRTGIKEDCYGFYPSGSKAFIGGQGAVRSEFKKNPSRFSRVTISITKPISPNQRMDVLRLVNDWNSKNYSLTDQSCIDFVNSVAQKLGWKIPPRVSTDLPETYLKKLAAANP